MDIKRTTYEFRMVEQDGPDVDSPVRREVVSTFVTDDGATHPTVTEKYFEFIKGCGYLFAVNDEIRHVRESEGL